MDRHERFSSLVDRDVAWHGRLVNSYRTAGAQDTKQKGPRRPGNRNVIGLCGER
jgi:hypothetical protein